MILYFLRHANAGVHLINPKKDEKRALDKEGIEQCGYIGRALAALEVQVDAIVSSPLKRATQTASLVANHLGNTAQLHSGQARSGRRLRRAAQPASFGTPGCGQDSGSGPGARARLLFALPIDRRDR